MTARAKIIVTGVLLLCIVALAGIDAAMNRREFLAYLPESEDSTTVTTAETPAPETTGVAKVEGPDVEETIKGQALESQETSETSLLEQVVNGKGVIHTLGILKDGDRVGAVTWVESPQVKTFFIALKEALLPAFSPKVTDLRDTTEAKPGNPVRNILTFKDPELGPDRFAFVRSRERLYEFHMAEGQEVVMSALVDALTGR